MVGGGAVLRMVFSFSFYSVSRLPTRKVGATIYGATISHDLQIIETLEDVLFQRHRVGLLGLMLDGTGIFYLAACRAPLQHFAGQLVIERIELLQVFEVPHARWDAAGQLILVDK